MGDDNIALLLVGLKLCASATGKAADVFNNIFEEQSEHFHQDIELLNELYTGGLYKRVMKVL